MGIVDTKNRKIPKKPLVTVRQARKLMGDDGKDMTNEDIERLIDATEQFARALLRNGNVHKQALV